MDSKGNISGVLIAGGENGNIILYDPSKIIAGDKEVVIAQNDKHTGPVRALDVNIFQVRLLMFIHICWDTRCLFEISVWIYCALVLEKAKTVPLQVDEWVYLYEEWKVQSWLQLSNVLTPGNGSGWWV